MQKSKTRSFLGRLLRGGAVLAMAAVVLPKLGAVKAEAASYSLTICGTTVTDDNKSDILGDGVFSYDPSTYTLSVHGNKSYRNDRIIYSSINGLTIDVTADSELYGTSSTVVLTADTTITGTGKLTLSASTWPITGYALLCSKTLTIKDITLSVSSSHGAAIRGYQDFNSKLIINNANVSASGASVTSGASDTHAISSFNGGVTLTGCAVISPEGIDLSSGNSKDSAGNIVNKVEIMGGIPLWVGGTQVNGANFNDILGDGNFCYLPASKTLQIGGDLTTSEQIVNSEIDGLAIVIERNCELKSTNNHGFVLLGDTTITGCGELHLISEKNFACYVKNCARLTISEIKMSADGKYYGITGNGSPGDTESESLGLQHCEVSASGDSGAICDFYGGISFYYSVPNNPYARSMDLSRIYDEYDGDEQTAADYCKILKRNSVWTVDCTVDGVQVTEANAADILGNGVFSWDDSARVLYVNGTYVSPCQDVICPCEPGLTIELEKDSVLKALSTNRNAIYVNGEDTVLRCDGPASLISAKSDAVYILACNLTIQPKTSNGTAKLDVTGFSSAFCGSSGGSLDFVNAEIFAIASQAYTPAVKNLSGGLTLTGCDFTDPRGAYYTGNGGTILDKLGNEVFSFQTKKIILYPLLVDDVQASNINCDDILGNGIFEYDPDHKALYIKGSYTCDGDMIRMFDNMYVNVDDDITLTSESGNVIEGDTSNWIYLGISGGKTLTLSAPEGIALYAQADFAIYSRHDKPATLIASGWSGLCGTGDNLEIGGVNMTVTANGSDSDAAAIRNFGSITLEDCRITAGGTLQEGTVVGTDGNPSKSVTVKATTKYDLWIAGTQVTEFNQNDILGNGVFTFIPASNLLVIDGSYTNTKSECMIYSGISGLRIEAVSDSVLKNDNGYDLFFFCGDTTITGAGKLTLKAGDDLAEVNYCTLTFDGIEVEATAYDDGFYGNGGYVGEEYVKAKLVFKNTKLHMTAGSGDQAALYFGGGIELIDCRLAQPADAQVKANYDEEYGIVDSSDNYVSEFTITTSKALTSDMITLSKTEFPYKNGEEVKIGSYITVKDGDTKLKYGTDFTLMYLNNKDLGIETALLRVIGIGAYEGTTITKPFSIVPVQQAKPTLTYKDGKLNVAWSKDSNAEGYQVMYSKSSKFSSYNLKAYATKTSCVLDEPAAGEKWYVRVRSYIKDGDGKKHGIWSESSELTLVDPITSVSLSKSTFPYTGNAVKVGSYITVKSGDTKLKYGDDFTLTYSENIECGVSTAKVTVKGTGKYTGTITKKYTIVPAQQAKPTLTVKNGKLNAKWAADSKAQGYQVQYSKDSSFSSYKLLAYATKTSCELPEPALGEKWYVRVRSYIKGSDGKKYGIWSESSVKTLTLPIDSVTLSKSSFAYTGSQVKVGSYITVKSGDTKLKYGDDFTLTYSENVVCGVNTAKVTVKGTGKYSGTISKNYTIYPAQQAAPKLSTVSGKLHAAWTKDTNAQGYQVQYCQNKDFTGDTLHSSGFAATATNGDLKYGTSGSLWYVRVRAYITSSSGTKYGEWSAISSLKVGKLSTVTLSQSTFTYTGNPIKVGSYITVKSGNTKLKYGTDFTLSYKNNTAKGTATVTVTGIGEYSGTLSKTYTIK